METTHLSCGKSKDEWNCNKLSFEGDHSCGFSIQPPKNYPCSFCKRAFRSAQALGGHMNVHRRDRARLRQLPSWVLECPNPNPNPNPNFSSSSSASAKSLPFSYTHHSLLSPSLTSFTSPSASTDKEKKTIIECAWHNSSSPRCEDIAKKRSMRDVLGVGELKGVAHRDELKVLKKGEKIRLDLEMKLLRDPKEDLDLELRLGCL